MNDSFILTDSSSKLALYSSSNFDIHCEILHLHKTILEKKQGCHDYLVNKLYSYQPSDIDFYLPEICYMMLNYQTALQKFVLNISAKDLSCCMKVLWIIDSFGNLHNHRPKYYKKHLDKVTEKLENTAVNAGLSLRKIASNQSIHSMGSFNDAVLKEIRNSLKDTAKDLIYSLVNNCFSLKQEKIENRKKKLKSLMIRTNNWLWLRKLLPNEFDKWKFSGVVDTNNTHKQGVLFPFSKENNMDSNLIVRILHAESTCFNTKKRVPYRVIFETIDSRELSAYGPDYSKDPEYELLVEKYKISVHTENMTEEETKKLLNDILPYDKEVEKQQLMEETQEYQIKIQNMQKYLENKKQEEEAKLLNKKEGFDLINENIKKTINEKLLLVNKEEHNFKIQYRLYHSASIRDIRALSKIRNNAINTKKVVDNRPKSSDFYTNGRDSRWKKLKKQIRKKQCSAKNWSDWKSLKEITNHLLFFKKYFLLPKNDVSRPETKICLRNYHTLLLNKLKDLKCTAHKKYDIGDYLIKLKKNKQGGDHFGGVGPWEILWDDKIKILMKQSPYSHFPSYRCRPCIIKGGDDLRQEVIAMQIIKRFSYIFEKEKTGLYLKPYEIIALSPNSGLLEFVPDSISIDGLKKQHPGKSLRKIYEELFGVLFVEAQKNFIESLAAYSLLCYLLQIKDRHNGNILIVAQGRIVHIDFGFILSISPGAVNFESAPFKLTKDYLELMDGENSPVFHYFKILLMKGLSVLKDHVDEFSNILQIMMKHSDLPCFQKFSIPQFQERFGTQIKENELHDYVHRLVQSSINNKFTNWYDDYQKLTNGIEPQIVEKDIVLF